jgi:hypothetical protein
MGNDSDDSRLFISAAVSSEELLRRARARLRASVEPPADSAAGSTNLQIDLVSGAGLLGGWYSAEHFGDVPVRWTQRCFDFAADVGAATHVEIDALLPEESGLAELRGRLWVNDCAGDAFRIRPGWNRLLVPIPAGVSGPAHFSIDAGAAWCPLEQSVNDDGRELSMCVRRLALVRLELPRAPARRARSVAPPSAPAPAPTAPAAAPLPRQHAVPAPASPARRFDTLRALGRATELEQRIGECESAIAGMIPGLEPRLSGTEARLRDVEARLQGMQSALESALEEVENALSALVSVLEARLAAIEDAHRELRADVAASNDTPAPRTKP